MKTLKHIILLSASLLLFLQMGFTQGDNPEPSIVTIGGSSTINCLSANQEIGVEITGWVSGFNYQWNTGQTDSVISVKPSQTTTYFLQISNNALGISELRGFEVKVENDPIKVVPSNYLRDKKTCKGSELLIEPAFSGGYAPYSYAWDNGTDSRTKTIYPERSSEHRITITDVCGTESMAKILVEVEEHDPLIPANPKTIEFDCIDETLSVKPNLSEVSGGVGSGYKYSFDAWVSENKSKEVKANDGAIIIVQFTDACSQQIVSSEIELIQRQIELPTVSSIVACENQVVDITETENEQSFYFWDGNAMNPEYNLTVVGNEEVTLTYLDVCGDAQTIDRDIVLSKVESTFDYDAHESTGTVDLFTTNTDEDLTYEWKVNGDVVGTASAFEVSLESGSVNQVELTTMNKNGCMAVSSRTVNVRDNYSVPSAFSPNNDGKNDFFRLNIDEEFSQFSVEIFDRWGQLIFQSNDQYFAWKGEEKTKGILNTYVYRIKGTTIVGGNVDKTGTLTVVN